MSPYLQALGSDFNHGAKFAYFGARAETEGPFPLATQIDQFKVFQDRTRLLRSQGFQPTILKIYTVLMWYVIRNLHIANPICRQRPNDK